MLKINGLRVCNKVLCPWKQQVNAFFAFDRNRMVDVVGNIQPVVALLRRLLALWDRLRRLLRRSILFARRPPRLRRGKPSRPS